MVNFTHDIIMTQCFFFKHYNENIQSTTKSNLPSSSHYQQHTHLKAAALKSSPFSPDLLTSSTNAELSQLFFHIGAGWVVTLVVHVAVICKAISHRLHHSGLQMTLNIITYNLNKSVCAMVFEEIFSMEQTNNSVYFGYYSIESLGQSHNTR